MTGNATYFSILILNIKPSTSQSKDVEYQVRLKRKSPSFEVE
jgi:hypothetical protein